MVSMSCLNYYLVQFASYYEFNERFVIRLEGWEWKFDFFIINLVLYFTQNYPFFDKRIYAQKTVTFITKYSKLLLKLLLKLIPFLMLLISIIWDIKNNNGIISHYFYVLPFLIPIHLVIRLFFSVISQNWRSSFYIMIFLYRPHELLKYKTGIFIHFLTLNHKYETQ